MACHLGVVDEALAEGVEMLKTILGDELSEQQATNLFRYALVTQRYACEQNELECNTALQRPSSLTLLTAVSCVHCICASVCVAWCVCVCVSARARACVRTWIDWRMETSTWRWRCSSMDTAALQTMLTLLSAYKKQTSSISRAISRPCASRSCSLAALAS
jgi:hypothetical protein